MNRAKKITWFLPGLLLSLFASHLVPLAFADSFTDGFEGSSLNSFWTETGPGTATLTSAAAFSGSQSVLLSDSSTSPFNATIEHDFGSEQTGSVSVYIDTDVNCCGSAGGIEIFNSNDSEDLDFQTTPSGGFVARVNPGPSEVDYSFAASAGWHELGIDTTSSGTTFLFDGSAIFTDPTDTEFESVTLGVHGGPGGSWYFDSFNANTATAVPEPGSLVLFATGLLGVGINVKRRFFS